VRTLNIVQSTASFDDVSTHLKAVGGTIVVSDAHAARYEFVTKVLADMPKAKLGLNGTGGAAAGSVAKALAPGATLVTYNSAGKAVSAPLGWFTNQDLTLKGFSLTRALSGMTKAQVDTAVAEAVAQIAAGHLKVLVAREPAKDLDIALKRAMESVERQVVLHW
jgi:NADPH:quinone reductase-like Zn-dependent oxidoreductase